MSSLLSAQASIGAVQLSVQNSLGFSKVGTLVIGNPSDTVNSEAHQIAEIGVGSIKLTSPLTKSHPVGTPVSQAAAGTVPGKDCQLVVPADCVLPFSYKGLQYSSCTGVDVVQKLWCSKDAVYAGRWSKCTDQCSGKWPVKKIVSTVVAGSVAATGIGLAAAAVANQAKHGKFNPFGGLNGIQPVGDETIGSRRRKTKMKMASKGQPFVIVPATETHAGVMGQIISDGRRLLTVDAPVHMPMVSTDASQLGPIFAFAFIVFVFFVCGIAAPGMRSFARKRKTPVEPYLQA